MIALCWNCQGLGTHQSIKALRECVQRWDPKVVFLSETKKKIAGMKRVKVKLDFLNGFYVQREGKGRGLAMFWRKEINLEIKSYSKHHIDVVITEEATSFKWRITRFYGHPETHRRKESWSFLNTLNQQYHLPWLCLGDFNEILSTEEKLGGAPRLQQQMDAFRNVVNKCRFKDMGYSRSKYTWCNQQEGENMMYLRLDKAFSTIDWLEHFRDIKVRHLVDTTSDHCPLLLPESWVLQQRG